MQSRRYITASVLNGCICTTILNMSYKSPLWFIQNHSSTVHMPNTIESEKRCIMFVIITLTVTNEANMSHNIFLQL